MNRVAATCLVALVAASFGASATNNVGDAIAKEAVHIVFTEAEKKIIRGYFAESADGGYSVDASKANRSGAKKGKKKDNGMPPGLAKRKSLPPGLERQLERNGTLPPGLQKKALPSDLQSRLPAARRGYERVIVDSDVLLVDVATGVIRDIVRDVLK